MGKMTARKAFPVYFRRIRWLYHKIAENQIKGAPCEHYREEIEALFWFADRVIEIKEAVDKIRAACVNLTLPHTSYSSQTLSSVTIVATHEKI